MSLIPLSLIIFLGFLAVVCLFDFVFRLYWFKYFLATMGLIASGVVFFISFYGFLSVHLVNMLYPLSLAKKPKQKKKAKTA
ncbi:Undefined function [Listeria monocytogenes N53-1]|nr:Undefined function [Listeria monocytogenes N53-1]